MCWEIEFREIVQVEEEEVVEEEVHYAETMTNEGKGCYSSFCSSNTQFMLEFYHLRNMILGS